MALDFAGAQLPLLAVSSPLRRPPHNQGTKAIQCPYMFIDQYLDVDVGTKRH